MGSYESIPPSFQTPQGQRVNVISVPWQVETKLTAWFSRRKNSDFEDFTFLLLNNGHEIAKWSQFLNENMRETLYAVYEVETGDREMCDKVKKILSL